jgi:hypothetical protein
VGQGGVGGQVGGIEYGGDSLIMYNVRLFGIVTMNPPSVQIIYPNKNGEKEMLHSVTFNYIIWA